MTQLNAHSVLCLVGVYCGLERVNGDRDYCEANLSVVKEGHVGTWVPERDGRAVGVGGRRKGRVCGQEDPKWDEASRLEIEGNGGDPGETWGVDRAGLRWDLGQGPCPSI